MNLKYESVRLRNEWLVKEIAENECEHLRALYGMTMNCTVTYSVNQGVSGT